MSAKFAILIDGMYGIGDNLHQRALLRELMKTYDVWLRSCHFTLYHDLVEQGLKILYKGTRLRAQARTVAQEHRLFHTTQPPLNAKTYKVWYNKPDIDKHGSILESMLGELGYRLDRPDFSLPIKQEWAEAADKLIREWNPDKPILILRQLVLRREWDGSKRNPDPNVFYQIYREVRNHYWTLSIADLAEGQEWIEGPELKTNAKIHDGSLTFGTMAALYSRAALVLSPAGHGPVLAQATGTPVIVVYGGRESYRTTDRAGAHLAPTLGIDPDNPCDCHSNAHNCNKHTSIEPAREKVRAFLMRITPVRPLKTLLFATTYVDCEDRQKLTSHWLNLHSTLNPEADLLIVDAKSPYPILPEEELKTFETYVPGKTTKRALHTFPENVGHLSRGGKDGWGRAFCFGLDAAIDGHYDYVGHIEGDLLFKRATKPIFEEMEKTQTKVASVAVKGTQREIFGWTETALMFFQTEFLIQHNFTERYNWPRRLVQPTPEVVVRELLAGYLKMMPLKVLRGDKNQITRDNVVTLELDGITHCHNDVWAYDRFVEAALKEVMPSESQNPPVPGNDKTKPQLRLNLGCGTNHLPGWENHDTDIDIRNPLPWETGTVELIFIEHCVEHVSYHHAVRFMEEAHRVLVPGGTLRITVPSLEQIATCEDEEYYQFAAKWGGEPTKRGATRAIIFSHGHEQAWTASLMEHTLGHAGFYGIRHYLPGESENPALKNLEGHGKVIGDKFNRIESMCFEGTKPGRLTSTVTEMPAKPRRRTAVVVGGAENYQTDLDQALELCRQAETEPTLFLVNDQMAVYPGEGIGCTLHPAKLGDWVTKRRQNNYPDLRQIWAHRKDVQAGVLVTNVTHDWAGSSGLFAVKIALELRFEQILLCGVPMTPEGMHFVRHQPWDACHTFRRGWNFRYREFAQWTRSFSGWTAEKLGKPTLEFVRGETEIREKVLAQRVN